MIFDSSMSLESVCTAHPETPVAGKPSATLKAKTGARILKQRAAMAEHIALLRESGAHRSPGRRKLPA